MPKHDHYSNQTMALAGLAGGLAEVAWVGLYLAISHGDGSEVLRQIAASFSSAAAARIASPPMGMVIHFSLALTLAFAYGHLSSALGARGSSLASTLAFAVATLAGVWAINFLMVLPRLNPTFIALMPYSITLMSKLLFGVAMGAVLHGREHQSRTEVAQPA